MELPSMDPPPLLIPPFSESHNLLQFLPKESKTPLFLPPNHSLIPNTTILPSESLNTFLATELLLPNLTSILLYLRYASEPSAPLPLHQRRSFSHDILIDERPDWHMICTRSSLTLKPIPPFLLSPSFWKTHICVEPALHAAATGFLLSYTSLIRHHSDYLIATELNLIPSSIPWLAMSSFFRDIESRVLQHRIRVDQRYTYGELWLKELCIISFFVNGWEKRFYHLFDDYVSFGLSNYAQLLAVFAVIGLLLSALQVGLDTDQGGKGWFVDMSWGFSLVSLGLAIGSAFFLMGFLGINYVLNMRRALKWDKEEREKGVRGGWENQNGIEEA